MRLLDLYCGVGGAAMGYHRAGFTEIVGVDLREQPNYPFTFVRGDALEFLSGVAAGEFDLIHASPPCQHYSGAAKWKGTHMNYPDLLPATREALIALGTPWAIENVLGAPMRYAVTLCGTMFGLRVLRHRLFETSHLIFQPDHPPHRGRIRDGFYLTIAGHGGDSRDCRLETWKAAMGISWATSKREVVEAIPPAYTEWLGMQMRLVMGLPAPLK